MQNFDDVAYRYKLMETLRAHRKDQHKWLSQKENLIKLLVLGK